MSLSRPHSAAHVAGHDGPLIGERAATRVRIAAEAGDAHAGVSQELSVRAPAGSRHACGEQRDQGRARLSIRSAAFVAHRNARSSANAPQRAGEAQRRLR
jgi:hypothetical protein